MVIVRPFILTQSTTVAGTAKQLVAAPQLVRSFRVQPHAGNTSPIFVGPAGAGKQLVLVTAANPLVVFTEGAGPDSRAFLGYDLSDLYILAGTNGDGVDVFGYA